MLSNGSRLLGNQTKESTLAQFKHSYLQSQSLQLKLSAQKMLDGQKQRKHRTKIGELGQRSFDYVITDRENYNPFRSKGGGSPNNLSSRDIKNQIKTGQQTIEQIPSKVSFQKPRAYLPQLNQFQVFADSILNTESAFNSFRKSDHKDKDSSKPPGQQPPTKKRFPATISRARGKQAHSQHLHVGSQNLPRCDVQSRHFDDYQELSKASKASKAPTSGNGEEATLTTGPSPKPKRLPNLIAGPSLQSQRSLQKIYRKSNMPKMPTQDQARSRTIRNISPLAARPPIESTDLPISE